MHGPTGPKGFLGETGRTDYVAGFLFSIDWETVLLIEKNKPDWQRGRLNGVGGKIEPGESPIAAMSREFEEEAGISPAIWCRFCSLTGEDWRVHFFVANGYPHLARQMTGERLHVVETKRLLEYPILPNLKWLVPMAEEGWSLRADVSDLS